MRNYAVGIMNIKGLIYFTAVMVLFETTSCKKDVSITSTSGLKFHISYSVDKDSLTFDSIRFVNASGNHYSVNRLEYYLSGFTFTKSEGGSFVSPSVCYMNATEPATSDILINAVPQGNYAGLSFYIGLDPEKNKTNFLPNTLDNINMAWPDAMGGGYHFMKMEGYFLDSTGKNQNGFAMHLGKNENLVKVEIIHPFILTDQTINFGLKMNLNEWFKNPVLYDLNKDGNYSMGNVAAMTKLSQNGKDVFTLE